MASSQLAGRVEDDDVRVEALGGELGRGFARIGAEEAAFGGNSAAHAGGVGLGALNGFGDDLHADELAAAVCHREADGAHAAVEVEQEVLRLELGVVGGDAVQPLGGEGVDLIERQGPSRTGTPQRVSSMKPGPERVWVSARG